MNAQSRRRIEMGARVLKFNSANSDSDAGYNVTAAKLEQLMQQADAAAAAQREGRAAAREDHELATAFRFRPGSKTFQAFRVAARGMQLEAQTQREVLVKHGLSESVLEQFGRMLDEFDAAIALGIEGRSKHMGATAQLRLLATEIARAVRVMNGRNRQRFEENGQMLASWLAASAVLGTPRGGGSEPVPARTPEGGTPSTGEVRPAA